MTKSSTFSRKEVELLESHEILISGIASLAEELVSQTHTSKLNIAAIRSLSTMAAALEIMAEEQLKSLKVSVREPEDSKPFFCPGGNLDCVQLGRCVNEARSFHSIREPASTEVPIFFIQRGLDGRKEVITVPDELREEASAALRGKELGVTSLSKTLHALADRKAAEQGFKPIDQLEALIGRDLGELLASSPDSEQPATEKERQAFVATLKALQQLPLPPLESGASGLTFEQRKEFENRLKAIVEDGDAMARRLLADKKTKLEFNAEVFKFVLERVREIYRPNAGAAALH